jgi:hypothetical protein
LHKQSLHLIVRIATKHNSSNNNGQRHESFQKLEDLSSQFVPRTEKHVVYMLL